VPAHGRMRAFDRDLIRGGHYGQRPCVPHSKPNTWLHRPMLQTFKKVLANSAPSTHDAKRASAGLPRPPSDCFAWRNTMSSREPREWPCPIYISSSMTSMPTNRPWLSSGLKTVPKCRNLRKSEKTILTKLDCPSRGEFLSLVAVQVRCAVRSPRGRDSLEPWLDRTSQLS
jgi:hypothetical protein